ncbi:hypothetical protein RQP46_001348 [Phenoliferia psychrophenolica]
MLLSLPSTLLFLSFLVGPAFAGTTVKRSVLIPTSLSALCKEWKAECSKEAFAAGTGVGGFLFRCKPLSSTVATVTCVSKDFKDSSVPEEQLTDPVIKNLGLQLAPKPSSTSSSATSSSTQAKLVASTTKSSTHATPPAKKDPTIKRTVKIPTGLSLGGMCKKFKTTCASKAAAIADSGSLFRCKSVSTTLRTATVTCVSKASSTALPRRPIRMSDRSPIQNFSNPSVPEQQLTDTVIAALRLKLAKGKTA